MTVNGITGKTFYEKLQGQKKKNLQDEAQSGMSFSDNLAESSVFKGDHTTNETQETDDIIAASSSSHTSSIHTSMLLHESGRIKLSAVIECSARNIRYAQSDHVKVYMEDGYVLKAQVEASEHKVYIEKKMDNGEVIGYEVDPLKLSSDTEDPIEQMALESWELAKRAFMGENPSFHVIDPIEEQRRLMGDPLLEEEQEEGYEDLTIEEAMQKFYNFVEDRIKNGGPKYRIGAAEISVKEWNRLLKKVDAEIDAAKEQLREKVKKAKEKAKKVTPERETEVIKSDSSVTKEQIARLFEEY
ncbi:MAG: hypothetical protein HFI37_05070 [Lachnospiraceae bacterium]|nr:hypothetical protein [Lachnospiraceae bacterium]